MGALLLAGALLPASAAADHPPPVFTHGDPAVAFTPTVPPIEPRFAGISPTWCGTERSTDDTHNETGSLSDAKVHIVYAYPSGATNRFSTLDDVIQADVNAIVDRIAAQPGSAKSMRFDLGTDNATMAPGDGTGCVDITTIALPGTASYYDTGTFGKVVTDVAASFPGFSTSPGTTLPATPRNIMIYADIDPPGTVQGTAQQYGEDSEAGGYHNLGGLMGVIYDQAAILTDATAAGIEKRRVAVMHETGHLLGAVQSLSIHLPDDPPHGSGSGHCYEEWDVMCYDDDGPFFDPGGGSLLFTCGTMGSPVDSLFDCAQDDYFDPTETMGTYLDTHWNLYDSPFMCAISPSTICASDDIAPSQALTVTKAGTGTGVILSMPGISCPADCDQLYPYGHMVSLTQMTGTGSTFTGWSGACTGTGACMVTMDGAKSVTGTFTADAVPPPPTGGGTTPATNPTAPAPRRKCKKGRKLKKGKCVKKKPK